MVFFIRNFRDFIHQIFTIRIRTVRIGTIVVLRLDLLHLGQHLLRTVLLHTRSLVRHARRLRLRVGSRVLSLLEKSVLGWRLREGNRGRVWGVSSRTGQPLHRFSLSLSLLLSDLLLRATLRTDGFVLILRLRPTAIFLRIEQPRIGIIILLDILMRGVDRTTLPLLP